MIIPKRYMTKLVKKNTITYVIVWYLTWHGDNEVTTLIDTLESGIEKKEFNILLKYET